jgi:FkbM family methyltransferase
VANNNKILIIGNGPSAKELAELGFENLRPDINTFGMGIGYRYFREINWWPTLYACGDSKVVFSHQQELAKTIEDPDVSTQRFYFSWPVSEHPRFELIDHCSTGDFCFRKSLELGYREIYLIGIEGHYVEEILESRPLSEEEYEQLGFDQLGLLDAHKETLRIITKTPADNPNYFFYGYQQAGDVYSLPQSTKHRDRWKDAAEFADAYGVNVINLSASARIMEFPKSTLANVSDSLLGNSVSAQDIPPMTSARSAFWYGPFDRGQNKRVEESDVVRELFQSMACLATNKKPVMVDVGACKGGAFREFAQQGWVVHAFEPNPPLYADLLKKFNLPNVTLNNSAVSDVEGEEIPFYTSEESLGISSLKPFRDTHELAAHVKTIKLDNYLGANGIKGIDFLKVDTEGFDLMVLKGLDLGQYPAEAVLCEFEDRKTKPLGYSMQDMADYLQSFGYTVYVSEWHPVVRYGIRHQWRALKLYPCELEDPNGWGNLLAFKQDPGIGTVTRALRNSLRKQCGDKGVQSVLGVQSAPFYAEFGERLRARSPRVFALLRFARRAVAGVWRRRLWTVPVLAVITLVAFLGLLPTFADYRALIWGGLAFSIAMLAVLYLAVRLQHFVEKFEQESARQKNAIQAALKQIERLSEAEETAGRLKREGATVRKTLSSYPSGRGIRRISK